jgi:hypothetical protein
MYNVNLENQLIITNIVDTMIDYVSLQPDIDESKVKAACIVAQKIDIARVIGKANVARCIDPQTPADEELLDLVIPALCYFTYARLLKMFQGTFTDSGYIVEGEAVDKNMARSTGNEMSSIAEAFLLEVVAFLKLEDPNDEAVDKDKINPRIRVFGGKEIRASN